MDKVRELTVERVQQVLDKVLTCVFRQDGSHDWACCNCTRRKEILAALASPEAAPAPPSRQLRKILSEHWLAGVHCHHAVSPDDSTYDWAACACSKVNLPHRGTVGEAVGTWIEHVLEQLALANSRPAEGK